MSKNKLEFVNHILEARESLNIAYEVFSAMYEEGEEEKDYNDNLLNAGEFIDKELERQGVNLEEYSQYNKLIIDGEIINREG